ncbi:MAG: 2,3-bisphosphoglycerate-independent phosphoglycerate mutase [Tissierellia bacterium]|nr:2,3-bisphosphoglycerate-independent phosphoglycerate mutase [Tissierellia bacterium]
MKRPVMLIILDGFGIGIEEEGNAALLAKTPFLDDLAKNNPTTTLRASGHDVGLPEGQMGNSEVGHLNIGAGRIMYQNLTRITKEIEEGKFFENPELIKGMKIAKEKGVKCHLMGLISQGGVHSHMDHLYALMDLAQEQGLDNVYVHGITDGRDVSPHSSYSDIKSLIKRMEEKNFGKLATICGRYYAMDRDKRWDRTEKAYRAYFQGEGIKTEHILYTIEMEYQKEITDEFLPPIIVEEKGEPAGTIGEEDVIIFFNFRPDRARQIVRSITDPEFQGFQREKRFHGYMITMTDYDPTIPNTHIAYKDIIPNETLGQYLSEQGKTQLRIAETEKYAHVTFFLNGGLEPPFPGEDRVLIPSPKVATYDLQPEMSAFKVTEQLLEKIHSGAYDFIMLNFANPDMVGHTGSIPAAIKAVETVDTCIGEIIEALEEVGGAAFITADHGNCEVMLTKDGQPVTSHTTNLVPVYSYNIGNCKLKEGRLADLAPTILELMEMEKPKEMTGNSLIIKEEV